MAKKKTKRGEKPQRATRWTVRGIPVRLQKAAGEAARAQGLTLGQWLARLLEEGVARDAPVGAPSTGWAEAIEARLARLEARLDGAAGGEAAGDGEEGGATTGRLSGSARAAG